MDNFLYNADVPYDDYITYDEPIFYDGERLQKKVQGGSSSRRKQELPPKQPFISVSIASSLLAFNEHNVESVQQEIRYAEEDKLVEFEVNSAKIRTKDFFMPIESNFVGSKTTNFQATLLVQPKKDLAVKAKLLTNENNDPIIKSDIVTTDITCLTIKLT